MTDVSGRCSCAALARARARRASTTRDADHRARSRCGRARSSPADPGTRRPARSDDAAHGRRSTSPRSTPTAQLDTDVQQHVAGLRQLPRHADAVPRRRAARRRSRWPAGRRRTRRSCCRRCSGRRRCGSTTAGATTRRTRPAPRRRCGSATRSSPTSRRPTDETALDALRASPLEHKQVDVDASRYGANGRLVVTSVFAQGYTVVRRRAAAPTARRRAPTGDYDHEMVFSFSAPRDEQRLTSSRRARSIDGFAGGVSRVQRPHRDRLPADVRRRRRTATATLDEPGAHAGAGDARRDVAHEQDHVRAQRGRRRSRSTNGEGLPLDDDYTTYKQWKIDPAGDGGDCTGNQNVINVISTGVVADSIPRRSSARRCRASSACCGP